MTLELRPPHSGNIKVLAPWGFCALSAPRAHLRLRTPSTSPILIILSMSSLLETPAAHCASDSTAQAAHLGTPLCNKAPFPLHWHHCLQLLSAWLSTLMAEAAFLGNAPQEGPPKQGSQNPLSPRARLLPSSSSPPPT